jgi:hypothetical protein
MTRNADVKMLCVKVKEYAYEFHRSVSNNLPTIRQADRIRMTQWLNDLRTLKAWIVGQPELDVPKSSPRTIPLEGWAQDEFSRVNNEVINQIVDTMWVMWVELATGVSTVMPNGLYPPDQVRYDKLMDKMERLLVDYADKILPLDLPESHPDEPTAGPGRHGPN